MASRVWKRVREQGSYGGSDPLLKPPVEGKRVMWKKCQIKKALRLIKTPGYRVQYGYQAWPGAAPCWEDVFDSNGFPKMLSEGRLDWIALGFTNLFRYQESQTVQSCNPPKFTGYLEGLD